MKIRSKNINLERVDQRILKPKVKGIEEYIIHKEIGKSSKGGSRAE